MGYGRYRENSLPQATLRPSGYGPDCVGAVIRERQLVVNSGTRYLGNQSQIAARQGRIRRAASEQSFCMHGLSR